MSDSPLSRRIAERPKPKVEPEATTPDLAAAAAEPDPAPELPVYRVLTGALGKRFVRGNLVTAADLGAHVDVRRLVRISAVELV